MSGEINLFDIGFLKHFPKIKKIENIILFLITKSNLNIKNESFIFNYKLKC